LIRIRFGIISLPPRLKRGMTEELGEAAVTEVLDWSGKNHDAHADTPRLAQPSGASLAAEVPAPGLAVHKQNRVKGKSGVKR
jgi:23S rRNA pseudouridine2605 synthase